MAGTFIGDPWKLPYTAQQIQDVITNGVPVVGDNGNWWRWDINTSSWVDTGVTAATSLSDNAVITSKLADGSITTPKLADGAVTWPKLAPEVQLDHRNLLDNWYFIGGGSQQGGGQFPINQRAKVTYLNGGYCIDRWYARAYADDQMSTTLESDGLLMTHAAGYVGSLNQRLECPDIIAGKVVTISFLLSVNTVTDGFDIGLFGADQVSLNSAYLVTAHVDPGVVGLVSVTGTVPENFGGKSGVNAGIYFGNHGGSIKIQAAKLELGPYQTLAHESAGGGGGWILNDPAPNFTDEMMSYKRYQRVVLATSILNGYITGGGSSFETPMSDDMRDTSPAFSFAGASAIIRTVSGYSEITGNSGIPIKSVLVNSSGKRMIFRLENDAVIGTNNTPAGLTLIGANIIIDKNL